MLLSEEYRSLNRELHQRNSEYGVSGGIRASAIYELAEILYKKSDDLTWYKDVDILDYGCGKGMLGKNLPFLIREYDPAIPNKDSTPDPADIVTCTDVMEHIEPECLDDVLDDLKRVTKKYIFLTIATCPAEKTLADGRNAHLIQEGIEWWQPKVAERFNIVNIHDADLIILIIGEAK